ncbi:MAG: class I SAM-dependent methyltransferase [Candidatus Rokuibacteriota bacterium]
MVDTLALEPITCPLCGAAHATPLWQERDVALGVPGLFPVARCGDCGLLYQNPRVRIDDMTRMYPADYPPHARNPDVARALADGAAVRTVLADRLGYRHLAATATWRGRVAARLRRRRIEKNFPPWVGEGRLLDVGCATGRFLQRMKAIGWRVSGIELDPEAAATAKTVTPDVVIGDPSTVTLPARHFDLITAFHVIEHLPDPLGALRNMLGWLAPGGLMIVEVPNAGGWGGRLFRRYWSGLDYPRHLVHFTPATMGAMVERAGGRVVGELHWSKPRWITRSMRHWLGSRPGAGARLALAALDSRLGGGLVKLVLEVALRPASLARAGEVARYFIRHAEAVR